MYYYIDAALHWRYVLDDPFGTLKMCSNTLAKHEYEDAGVASSY